MKSEIFHNFDAFSLQRYPNTLIYCFQIKCIYQQVSLYRKTQGKNMDCHVLTASFYNANTRACCASLYHIVIERPWLEWRQPKLGTHFSPYVPMWWNCHLLQPIQKIVVHLSQPNYIITTLECQRLSGATLKIDWVFSEQPRSAGNLGVCGGKEANTVLFGNHTSHPNTLI